MQFRQVATVQGKNSVQITGDAATMPDIDAPDWLCEICEIINNDPFWFPEYQHVLIQLENRWEFLLRRTKGGVIISVNTDISDRDMRKISAQKASEQKKLELSMSVSDLPNSPPPFRPIAIAIIFNSGVIGILDSTILMTEDDIPKWLRNICNTLIKAKSWFPEGENIFISVKEYWVFLLRLTKDGVAIYTRNEEAAVITNERDRRISAILNRSAIKNMPHKENEEIDFWNEWDIESFATDYWRNNKDLHEMNLDILPVFLGWFVKIEESFLGQYKIKLFDGAYKNGRQKLVTLYKAKSQTEAILNARYYVTQICINQILKWKRESSGYYNEVYNHIDTQWNSWGPNGKIPIGLFAVGLKEGEEISYEASEKFWWVPKK